MILRKPYAFLIKHFKLIHLVLALLSIYSIYRTKEVLDFFNEYISTMINVIGQDLTNVLIPGFYIFTPILIILVTLVILVVMIVKKKPNLFYIINIVSYIFVFVLIIISSSTLDTMSKNLVDPRVIMLTRDFVTISFIVQFIIIPMVLIRAIGFDIKKFNFKEDIKELEINEEDREEFEVQFNFDKNKAVRKFRRTKRFFKYKYKENRLTFNLAIVGTILIIPIVITINLITRTPVINQNDTFAGNGFNLSILNSYLVNTDYEGNIINEDYYYLILRIKIKTSQGTPQVLDTATTKIMIGNYRYIPLLEYKEKFFDFGKLYQNEKIGNEYEEKILAYQIPKQIANDKIIFSYVNKNSYNSKEGFKSTNVKINYKDLIGITSSERIEFGNEINFSDSILDTYKINITNYEIKDKFKIKYNYCVSKECYESYEYLSPTMNTNYDKSLLKITGTMEGENDINNIYDLYDFVESFGKICYNIDGVVKTQNLKLKEVVSTKVKKNKNFYIEVPSEIKNANNISIIFTIRDKVYEYVLK